MAISKIEVEEITCSSHAENLISATIPNRHRTLPATGTGLEPQMPDADTSVASGARPMEQLRRVTRLLLEPQRPAHSLRPEVLDLARMLADSQPIETTRAEDISCGE